MAYISLTEEDMAMLDTWHQLEKENIPSLLHCINKIALIHHLDDRYHLNPSQATSLLTLSDVLFNLYKNHSQAR